MIGGDMQFDEHEEDDTLVLTADDEADDQDSGEQQGGDTALTEVADDTVFAFGEAAEDQDGDDDAPLPKHLRAQIRERDRKLAEREKELQELRERYEPKPAVADPGPKPKLADFDYDEDEHDKAVDAWVERRDAFNSAKTEQQREQQASEQRWNQQVQAFATKKAAMGRADFDEVEETVAATLPQTHVRALVAYADDSAKLIYALGKNPAQLRAFAEIKDPAVMMKEMGRLEGQLRTVTRKAPANIDQPVRGSASTSLSSGDKHEERLEKEAARTGDRSSLIAYRAKKRDQAV